jgi:hypothetical protein
VCYTTRSRRARSWSRKDGRAPSSTVKIPGLIAVCRRVRLTTVLYGPTRSLYGMLPCLMAPSRIILSWAASSRVNRSIKLQNLVPGHEPIRSYRAVIGGCLFINIPTIVQVDQRPLIQVTRDINTGQVGVTADISRPNGTSVANQKWRHYRLQFNRICLADPSEPNGCG